MKFGKERIVTVLWLFFYLRGGIILIISYKLIKKYLLEYKWDILPTFFYERNSTFAGK